MNTIPTNFVCLIPGFPDFTRAMSCQFTGTVMSERVPDCYTIWPPPEKCSPMSPTAMAVGTGVWREPDLIRGVRGLDPKLAPGITVHEAAVRTLHVYRTLKPTLEQDAFFGLVAREILKVTSFAKMGRRAACLLDHWEELAPHFRMINALSSRTGWEGMPKWEAASFRFSYAQDYFPSAVLKGVYQGKLGDYTRLALTLWELREFLGLREPPFDPQAMTPEQFMAQKRMEARIYQAREALFLNVPSGAPIRPVDVSSRAGFAIKTSLGFPRRQELLERVLEAVNASSLQEAFEKLDEISREFGVKF